jgi:hypothetical protein
VQRQLGSNWLISANYLGNNTFHLVTEDQINPAIYTGPASTIANTNQRRPLYLQNPAQGQYYGIVAVGAPDGTGSYNALYLSAQKRMSNRTSVLVNYTWSHCISDMWNGQPGNNGVSNATPGNRRNDRGNCSPNLVTSDQRHVFNLSVVAQTPRFDSRALRLLASDWQFSPILKIRSAQLFTVSLNNDVALNGQVGTNQRPNLVSNPYPAGQSVNNWLSKAAFASPLAGQLGSVGIGAFRGPGMFQLDLAVSRTFRINERQNVQLRGEAFNLPNHLNPSPPVSTLNSGNFGQILSDISGTSGLSAGDYRVVQLALKYVF